MKIIAFLPTLPLLIAGGCVSSESKGRGATVLTQVPPGELAACIGRMVGSTPAALGSEGIVIPGGSQKPTRTYRVTKDKIQTIVSIEDYDISPEIYSDDIATNCALQLAHDGLNRIVNN
jgi:hypothetical protein